MNGMLIDLYTKANLFMLNTDSNLGFNTDNIGASAQGFEFNATTISTWVLIFLGIGALIAAGVVGMKMFGTAGDLASDERKRASAKEALPYVLVAAGMIVGAFILFFMIRTFVGL